MFTGIVEGRRRVVGVEDLPERRRLRIDLGSTAEGLGIGASVAVDGCCLTVVELDGSVAAFDLIAETLRRTAFSAKAAGDEVNVERCVKVDGRLDGHIVQGHVDGVGRILRRDDLPGELRLEIELPREVRGDPIVLKGSIALDGVSLTIAEAKADRVVVCLIPHTAEITTLGEKRPGDPIHVETDVVGKMVRALYERRGDGAARGES